MMLAQLTKARIAALVTLSAAAGYVLAAAELTAAVWTPLLGTFLLAGGAGALNQFQERDLDARMRRTMGRPIPSGRISASAALWVGALLVIAGLAILAVGGKPLPVLLGVLAIAWYNGLYTRLKRTSRFAAVPGAVIGAIPPAIGWTAAGGALSDPRLGVIMLFLFMWQVPHFWLLLLLYPADYRRADRPDLTTLFSPGQLARICFSWSVAAAAFCMAFPLFGLVRHLSVLALLGGVGLALSLRTVSLLTAGPPERQKVKHAFAMINVFAMATMAALLLEHALAA